jgi:hypothetical protein
MSRLYSNLDEQIDDSGHLPVRKQTANSESDLLPLMVSNWADVESEESDNDVRDKSADIPEFKASPTTAESDGLKAAVVVSAPAPNCIDTDNIQHEYAADQVLPTPDIKNTNPFAEEEQGEEEAISHVPSADVGVMGTHSSDLHDSKSSTISSTNIQTNPFAEDYDETTMRSHSSGNIARVKSVPAGGGTTNPFAEDFNPRLAAQRSQSTRTMGSGSAAKAPVIVSKNKPKETPALAKSSSQSTARATQRKSAPLIFPSDQPDMDTRRAKPKTSRTMKSPTEVAAAASGKSSSPYPEDSLIYKGTVTMMNLGFTPIASFRAMDSEQDYDKALMKLRKNLKAETNVKVSGSSPLWNPPVIVRIGKKHFNMNVLYVECSWR